MSDSIVFKYSQLIFDDGGFEKLKANFAKTGEDLITEAKNIKAELSKALTLDDIGGLTKLEGRVTSLEGTFKKYGDAKKAITVIENEHTKVIADQAKMLAQFEKSNSTLTKSKKDDIQVTQESLKADQEKINKLIDLQGQLTLYKNQIDQINKQQKTNPKASVSQDAQLVDLKLRLKDVQSEFQVTQKEVLALGSASQGAYSLLSAQLRELFTSAANVAAEMYILEQAGLKASPEYLGLADTFSTLQKRALLLDGTLKKIDGSLGRNQRNVGDYKKGYDGLNNSVQQVLRETPAAAISLNTFFLAISNNLPILFDNIQKVNAELKLLKEASAAAAAELVKLSENQKIATATAINAQTSYLGTVDAIVASKGATKAQSQAIREQIALQNNEIASNGFVSASTLEKTEAMLVEIGVTGEQIVAMRAQVISTEAAAAAAIEQSIALEVQTVATEEANAATAATPSLMKRLGESLFSVQSGLTLLVLGLTLFGGKIINFIENIGTAKRVLDELNKSSEKFSEAQQKIKVDTRSQLEDAQSILKLVADPTADINARKQAVKQIRNEYFYFFKQFSEGEILAGKANEAVKKLTESLKAQSEVKNLENFKKDTETRIEELKTELKARQDYAEERIRLFKIVDKGSTQGPRGGRIQNPESIAAEESIKKLIAEKKARQDLLDTKKDELRLNGSSADLLTTIASLEERISRTKQIIDFNRNKAILLDIKEHKGDKAKLEKQIKTVDFEASRYELEKTILENSIKNNETILASDKFTADERIAAQKQIVVDSLALAKLNTENSLRELKRKYNKERIETIKDSDGKILGLKYTNEGLLELEKQYQFDQAKVREVGRQAEKEANLKGEQLSIIQTLNFQLQNLKFLQSLSTNATQYESYYVKIKEINDKINKIINQNEGLELTDKIQINEAELKRLEEFNQRILDTFGTTDLAKLRGKQRRLALRYLKAFEDEKTKIELDGERQRQINRLNAIDFDIKNASSENDRKKLILERQALLKKLKEEEIKTNLDGDKKILDSTKKLTDEWKTLLESVLDKMIEIQKKRVESNEKAVENQKETITKQEELARAGLDNTLAFEQQQLAKREAALAKSQRKQEKLEKVKSLYASYSNYSSKGDENALAKALRDFAILESIAASFGKGGVVSDVLENNAPGKNHGIIRGRSHRGQNGGIPILVEGREGIFSAKEMGNLGKENFYRMKELASMGKVDTNFFTRQRKQFNMAVATPNRKNNSMESFSNDITRAIKEQPTQHWDKAEVIGDVVKIVETIFKPSGNTRNTYIIKKPKL